MRTLAVVVAGALALAACDMSHKVSLPEPVRGAWGADCTNPFVQFTESSIHLYADNATYALESATFNGNDLSVKYTAHDGPVSETYMKSGETLRLDHGTRAGAPVTAQQHAMNRCP